MSETYTLFNEDGSFNTDCSYDYVAKVYNIHNEAERKSGKKDRVFISFDHQQENVVHVITWTDYDDVNFGNETRETFIFHDDSYKWLKAKQGWIVGV